MHINICFICIYTYIYTYEIYYIYIYIFTYIEHIVFFCMMYNIINLPESDPLHSLTIDLKVLGPEF